MTISDIDIIETAIRVTSSTFDISDMEISRISDPKNLDLMFITLDSSLLINTLVFHDSESNLLNVRNTKVLIDDITIQNVSSFSDFIKISLSDNVYISQFVSINTTTDIDEKILITDSNNVTIDGIQTSDTPELIIDIVNSNVTSMSNLQIHN